MPAGWSTGSNTEHVHLDISSLRQLMTHFRKLLSINSQLKCSAAKHSTGMFRCSEHQLIGKYLRLCLEIGSSIWWDPAGTWGANSEISLVRCGFSYFRYLELKGFHFYVWQPHLGVCAHHQLWFSVWLSGRNLLERPSWILLSHNTSIVIMMSMRLWWWWWWW